MAENIVTTKGDILLTECEYLVQGIAERSVEDMGTGLAKAIHTRWPESYERFKVFRRQTKYTGGSMWVDPENNPRIINLATQDDLYRANLRYLNKALKNLAKYLETQEPSTIAIPRVGCGYGKLEWKVVRPIIDKYLADIEHRVFIYEIFSEDLRSPEEQDHFMSERQAKQRSRVTIIASKDDWIDGKAVAQLHSVAKLPEVKNAVGMPDLHAGRSIPVGFAVVTDGLIYPHLVGNDIGCGMGLYSTDLKSRRTKLDKWTRKLGGMELPWEGNRAAYLEKEQASPTLHDTALGTIGGGNHFAELQCIDEVVDVNACEKLDLNEELLVLLVHSGSRGLGQSIQQKYHQIAYHGLETGSDTANNYIETHDNAVKWAKASRSLISDRFLKCLGAKGHRVFDVEHNSVEKEASNGGGIWIHRKGASPSIRGPIVIPGSRGAFSYLVEPVGPQENNANSLPHGAGRKWRRSECKDRLYPRYSPESLKRTALGSIVVCDSKSLLYQEAPQAYKDIEVIISGLLERGLIKVIAKLRPIITYKVKR